MKSACGGRSGPFRAGPLVSLLQPTSGAWEVSLEGLPPDQGQEPSVIYACRCLWGYGGSLSP